MRLARRPLRALGVRTRWTLCIAPAVISTASAQHPTYSAAKLDCTRWSESSRSEIETVTSRSAGEATAGREGRWSFRARDTTGGVSLEGWYDSLSVWRQTQGARLTPDTDGVIGGRYRGLLGWTGVYTSHARPFVPDEVAEVAEVGGALDDLFPPLPPKPLAPGQSWRGSGTEITRLPDSVAAGRRLMRFAVRARHERSETVPHGDTLPIPVRQTITEKGGFVFDAASGLTRRTREIVVETSISSEGRVRQPVRSRVIQHVELGRIPGGGCS